MTDENSPRPPLLSRRDALKIIGATSVAAATKPIAEFAQSDWVAAKDATAANIPELPTPEKIGGVDFETIGAGEALTQEQTIAQIEKFNQEFMEGKVEMDPNTFYATWFIKESDYILIPTIEDLGSDTFEEFLQKQFDDGSRMLKEAGISGGLVCRRLIVVKDEVNIPASWHNGGFKEHNGKNYNFVMDSNGHDGLWYEDYDFPRSGWWNKEKGIDDGLSHEIIHRIIRLNDLYMVDSHFASPDGINLSTISFYSILSGAHPQFNKYWAGLDEETKEEIVRKYNNRLNNHELNGTNSIDTYNVPAPLQGVPEAWHNYSQGSFNYNDRKGIMTGVHSNARYGSWSRYILKRRQQNEGLHHNESNALIDHDGIRNHFPALNVLDLGGEWEGANVDIYQTDGDYLTRTLNKKSTHSVLDGMIDLGNPFANSVDPSLGAIPEYRALLLIKATKTVDGVQKNGFMWVDAGHFQEHLDPKNTPFGQILSVKLANSNSPPPEIFDFEFQSTPFDAEYNINMPIVTKGPTQKRRDIEDTEFWHNLKEKQKQS